MVQNSFENGSSPEVILGEVKASVIGGTGDWREGKGFSKKELKEAGLWNLKRDLLYDPRRKSCWKRNVEKLDQVKEKLPDFFPNQGIKKITIPRKEYEKLREQEENHFIKYIPLDDLTIDPCNMWESGRPSDEEMVNSVKECGIENPLLVRPTKLMDAKYGIVAGGRRYDAAIKAGLRELPCRVKKMDDGEAMNQSLMENYQRKDTPKWMKIRHVGIQYHEILNGNHEEKIEKIAETGIDRGRINRYLRIYELPEEVKGLLRKHKTPKQEEFLLLFSRRPNGILTPKRADLLTGLEKFPKEKVVEVGIFIINMKVSSAKRFVKLVEEYPGKDLKELRDRTYKEEYKKHDKAFRLNHELNNALETACLERQIHYQDLLRKILKDWLKKNGLL